MKFIEIGLLKNQYLFAHIIGGGLIAIILSKFTTRKDRIMLYTMLLAILWEVGEYFLGNIAVYGQPKYFFMDSFFDIIGALFGAILSIYNLKEERK